MNQVKAFISDDLNSKIEYAIKSGLFTTKSDLVRTAIRDLLNRDVIL